MTLWCALKVPAFRAQAAGWCAGVDASVRPGEIVTLIGPNGSGKSTTAKMALGVMTPTEGKVTQRPGLKTAYVPQKVAIDWTLPLRGRCVDAGSRNPSLTLK